MPGQPAINYRKAGVSLRVVVVGGGLAGIATSYTLQRAGHRVTVLERSDGTARVSSPKFLRSHVLLTTIQMQSRGGLRFVGQNTFYSFTKYLQMQIPAEYDPYIEPLGSRAITGKGRHNMSAVPLSFV